MTLVEFMSKDFQITDQLLNLYWDQSFVFERMKNRNLLIIDFNIDIIKNNPSMISLLNLHNYFPSKPELALIPGCALGYKNIKIDLSNNLNLIHLEFLGNYFNPYDNIKFSNEEIIKFTELHVENQKNKFAINQEKILEYFSEAILLNKHLKQLDISDNRLNELLFSKLVFCIKSNFNIKTLNISNNNLGEKSAVFINEILANNFFIENLIMSNIHLKNEGLKTLSHSLIKNKTLKNIDLSNNFLTCEGAEIFKSFLINNTSLIKLNISENNITDEKGNNPISEALKYNTNLEEINFGNCDFNEITINELMENLKENFSLRKLILSKNKLNEQAILILWDFLSNNNYYFNDLQFDYFNLTEKACEKIAESLKMNNFLNVLNLSNNKINDESMKIIFEALKHNMKLTEIDLSNNNGGKNIIFILSNLLLNEIKIKKFFIKGNFKEEELNLKEGFSFLDKMIKEKNIEIDISDHFANNE